MIILEMETISRPPKLRSPRSRQQARTLADCRLTVQFDNVDLAEYGCEALLEKARRAGADGIELEDGFIAADAVSYVGDSKNIIGIEIHSGRNRIVRRMLEHFGYEVKRLDRVYFAGLTKLNLPRGKWRFLTEKEITILKTGMYE